jgi:hypothetical protein
MGWDISDKLMVCVDLEKFKRHVHDVVKKKRYDEHTGELLEEYDDKIIVETYYGNITEDVLWEFTEEDQNDAEPFHHTGEGQNYFGLVITVTDSDSEYEDLTDKLTLYDFNDEMVRVAERAAQILKIKPEEVMPHVKIALVKFWN